MAGVNSKPFVLCSEDDMSLLIEDADSNNTKKQLKYVVKRMESFVPCVSVSVEALNDSKRSIISWRNIIFQVDLLRCHINQIMIFIRAMVKIFIWVKDGIFHFSPHENIFSYHCNCTHKYSPFQCSKEKYIEWYDKLLEETKMTWVQNIYWRLDEHSCILVERNKNWFATAKLDFKRIWEIILKERKEGFEHRRPNKRKPKTNIIIKIRTESFDICDVNLQKIIDANIKNAIY